MSYNISSEKFTHPLLKPILLELSQYFKESGISFFLIGATARDILMELNNERSGRLTFDLDIAISVNDWKQWLRVEKEILELKNFTKDKNQKQRFLYKERFQVDIVPYGEIMKQDSKIFWPPDENLAMSVLGFNAAEEASLKVSVDQEVEIRIASLSGIFLLKIVAWNDRHQNSNKDADDIGFILENYFNINEERAAGDYYDEIFTDEFTRVKGGATLLGKDILEILKDHPGQLEAVQKILLHNIEKKEESILVNQIIETHRTLSFEEVWESLKNLITQLELKEPYKMSTNIKSKEEIVLEDNELVCILTGEVKKIKNEETNLQSVILMLNEEYGFDLDDMERNFTIQYDDPDTATSKKQKVDLAVFEKNKPHEQDYIIRVCIIQSDNVKPSDKKKGVAVTLENAMGALENCEFGLWANGSSYNFLQKEEDFIGYDYNFIDLSDFPGEGETLEDLDRADRSHTRTPANDSLIKVFKRTHNYIYANEGRKKDAFWQLLNLIFCKLYDEKRRFMDSPNGESYRRKFWVGVKEQNTEEGRDAVAERIKSLFAELKNDTIFSEVFQGNESIDLTDKGLAFIAGELAKYSFLDASVDVKGMAYETIVSNTLKQEAGQFFTPRNIIKCMVDMLDPKEHHRVLDPACGSGGFLVMVLDHVRQQITKEIFPDLEGPYLEEKFNSAEVNERVRIYAERSIFGFDFDPDLKKAARMNMVMGGDGHANIFHVNSLAYPNWEHPKEIDKINEAIEKSLHEMKDINNAYGTDARGKFDIIFTNPPFGAKVKVETEVASRYHLSQYSNAPEVLFIEACYDFLKEGGKMAIVLPDGILGNPKMITVRKWILDKFKVIASIDLAVEAFLPQVGFQSSLLFLEKKTEKERQLAQEKTESYEVYMAVAEKLGKDRRGNPIYMRDDEGAELLFNFETKYLTVKQNGEKILKVRKEKLRKIDDDLPEISKKYKKFLKGEL